MKIEFPEGTPDFVISAVTEIHDRSESMLMDMTLLHSERVVGYCAAARELVNAIETQAAIERGDREDKIREARANSGESTQ